MAVFRSPAKQAASVMRELQGSHLKSVGTVRNYEQCLTRVTEWTQTHKLSDGLRSLPFGSAHGGTRARTPPWLFISSLLVAHCHLPSTISLQ